MQTTKIIEEIVSEIKKTIIIDSQETNDGIITISTKSTGWLTINSKIEIDGKWFKVFGLTINKTIKFKPLITGSTITANSFTLSTIEYKHGTLKMTQNEVDATSNKNNVFPLVWLQEPLIERNKKDFDSMIDRESDLVIYFLDSADSSNWLTDDHYTNVIVPMQSMVNNFIGLIENNRLFTYDFDFNTRNLINVSVDGKQENSIFDTNITGIELKLFAKIRKDLNCK